MNPDYFTPARLKRTILSLTVPRVGEVYVQSDGHARLHILKIDGGIVWLMGQPMADGALGWTLSMTFGCWADAFRDQDVRYLPPHQL